MSKSRSQRPKVEAALNDEPSINIQVIEGTDPESLPFLEWSDQDINLEKWDSAPLREKFPSSKLNVLLTSDGLFEDPFEVHVPPSFGTDEWKRVSEIFPDVSFSIFINRPTYPDLVTPNRHLLKSEFYRSFITSIETLLYIGSTKTFPEEYGSSSGYYAQSDRPWKPWHHIYSNCKVSRGSSEHSPLYNSFGKYVVRLYWMGSWRKIYVDDFMPLDKFNALLLPSFQMPPSRSQHNLIEQKPSKHKTPKLGGKKEIVELWPMILAKALLKIGALSWSTQSELNDFDIITCLTGWTPQRIKTKGIPSSDIWDIFMAYVNRFQWEEAEEGTKKTGSTKSKSKTKEKQEMSKKSAKGAVPSGIENMQDGDRFIVVSCDNFKYGMYNVECGLRNKNFGIFLSQVRDIPFIKPPPKRDLELWQKFRYEKWAVERGILPPDIPKLNIRTLNIIDPFKRITKGSHEFEPFDSKTQPTIDTERSDKKSDKSSKKPKDKVGKNRLEPDPTFWIEFDDIKEHIKYIQIYFQPRSFKSKAKISDINFQNKTADFKHIISPLDLRVRNEPTYLFIDSVDYKFLLINFIQLGNLMQLDKHVEADVASQQTGSSEERDICIDILYKKTEERDEIDMSVSQICNKSTLMCCFNTKRSNFVLEEYCWETNAYGGSKAMIETFGNKSVIVDLKPGRQSFRLWVSSHCSYVLQVFSDTPMTIGTLEEYILACTTESQLLSNLCYEFSSCFGKLVQSYGMPEYSISLRNFYQCYKPFENLTKTELVTVHKALFEEFCKVIANNSTVPNALEYIQLLFVQLKTFDYINPYEEETLHLLPDEAFNHNQIDYAKRMEQAAVHLQAFFKGIYIRLLMKKLNEDYSKFYGIFETLKRVYIEVFSSDKRLTNGSRLFRHFFERKDMEDLKEKFEIYRDMRSVVNVHVFADSLTVLESGWVPICRYEFYINSVEPVLLKINLFCNLKNYYIRVFNNDTETELKRYTNNVAVEEYATNVYGYTILGYGWAEESTKLGWKLIITKKRMSRSDLVIVPGIPTVTTNLKDYYMPNFNNIVCRYIVKITSDTFLTAHLRTSYDQVKVCLKLIDDEGRVVHTGQGTGSALLPVLHLRHKEKCQEPLKKIIAQRKKRSTAMSGLSEITYSKLNKKSIESVTSHTSSHKKVSVGIDVQESVSKRQRNTKKKGGSNELLDGDGDTVSQNSERSPCMPTSTSNHNQLVDAVIAEWEDIPQDTIKNLIPSMPRHINAVIRSRDSSGKYGRSKKTRTRPSDTSESESMSEKYNKKGSLKSRSYDKLNRGSDERKRSSLTVNRPSTLNKVVETDQTEYILEGTVLNSSWPLTAEEWQQTQQLREKTYLHLLGDKKNSISRKSHSSNKRSEEPYWVLDLVHSHEDYLEFDQDTRKIRKMRELKRTWFENVDRYKKGVELREAYLQENLVFNEGSINKNMVRSNNEKDFAVKIIKEPPIEDFMIRPSAEIDEDCCMKKHSEDYFIDETYNEKMLRDYKGDEQAIFEDNEELLQNQIKDFDILLDWFTEIRNDSSEMISKAVKLEKGYVKKYLEQSAKARLEKKSKDVKKKK